MHQEAIQIRLVNYHRRHASAGVARNLPALCHAVVILSKSVPVHRQLQLLHLLSHSHCALLRRRTEHRDALRRALNNVWGGRVKSALGNDAWAQEEQVPAGGGIQAWACPSCEPICPPGPGLP